MTDNEIILFKHEEFGEIRTLNIDGEPRFVGKDIAEVLGYSNTISTTALRSRTFVLSREKTVCSYPCPLTRGRNPYYNNIA